MTAPAAVRLPAAPLVEAIRARAERRGVPLIVLLEGNYAWERTLTRAARHGRVGLELAEELCERVLGWHARMLYGDAWDAAARRAAACPATPARPDLPHVGARTPSRATYIGGCRCRACRAANAAYRALWRDRQPRPRPRRTPGGVA